MSQETFVSRHTQGNTGEPRDRWHPGWDLASLPGELSQAVLYAFLNELVPHFE